MQAGNNPASLVPASKLDAQLKHFVCPLWAGKPEPGWHFAVEKGGTVIGKQDIDKDPYYLFGRDVNVADYVLEHPSVSRVHAAVVHHHSGSKFLIDLGTKYGTQVNGVRAPQMEPMRIQPGDRVKFAESSREYVLCPGGTVPAEKPSATRHPPVMPATTVVEVTSVQQKRQAPDTVTVPITKKSRVLRPVPSSTEVVQCSHIVLKHNMCDQPLDRHKLPVTRTRAVALAQVANFRKQLMEIPSVEERRAKLEQLAKQHSDCALTYAKGGLLGFVQRETLHEEFERVAFALQPGDLSEPVESPMGIHLIMRHN